MMNTELKCMKGYSGTTWRQIVSSFLQQITFGSFVPQKSDLLETMYVQATIGHFTNK